jgi:hypothetical protein
MPYKSQAQARYMNAAADRGDIKRSVVDEFNSASKGRMGDLPMHVTKKDKGGTIPCFHCGGSGYDDGGHVETMDQMEARHERERQTANDNYTDTAMASLHQSSDRPRVTVDDDEKQTRSSADTTQASNYAYGGTAADDSRFVTNHQIDDGERVNRRHDGSDKDGYDVPYEYNEETKEKEDFQRVFNNERAGHIAPIHNFAKGGRATAMSFAGHLAQKARMKGSPFSSRFKAGR